MQTVEILGRITTGRDDPAGFHRRFQIAIPRAQLRRRAVYRRRGFFGLGEAPSLATELLPVLVLALGVPLGYWWFAARKPRETKAIRNRRQRRERRIARQRWEAQ